MVEAVLNQKIAQQGVTHQPAISFSNSIHFPLIRAGGRTSNVSQEIMTNRQGYERLGFTKALETERYRFCSVCIEPNTGAEFFQRHWADVCKSVGVAPPNNLNNLRASSFRDRDFLCLSVSFPEPESSGDFCHATCVIGPIPDLSGMTEDKIISTVDGCKWFLFMLIKEDNSYWIGHYQGGGNIVKICDTEYLDEQAFTMLMFYKIANVSTAEVRKEPLKKGFFGRFFK